MRRDVGALACTLSWLVGCASPCGDGVITPGAVCFGEVVRLADGWSPDGVAAIDVDDDGRLDILVSDGRGVMVLRNEGDRTFSESLLDLPGAYDVAGADIDGDGRSDLVVATDQYVQVLLGAPDGTFTAGWRLDEVTYEMAVGDFDGRDGPDLVTLDVGVRDVERPRHLELRLNDGTGELSAPRVIASYEHSVYSIDAIDLEGDGDVDLYASYGPTDDVLINDGTGNFESSLISADRLWAPGLPAFADLDGDGDTDVLRGVVARSLIAYINHDGEFVATIVAHDWQMTRPVVAAGDIDADGDVDVLVTVREGELPDEDLFGIDVHSNLGDGTFHYPQRFFSTAERHFDLMVVADLDGDGVGDPIAVTNDGEVHALFSDP